MIDPTPVVRAPQIAALFQPPVKEFEKEMCGQCGFMVETPCDFLYGNPCQNPEVPPW